jgi:hypothetical protein
MLIAVGDTMPRSAGAARPLAGSFIGIAAEAEYVTVAAAALTMANHVGWVTVSCEPAKVLLQVLCLRPGPPGSGGVDRHD